MFIRFISHEMRTPLSTISMGLDILKSDLNRYNIGNDDINNLIGEMNKSCMYIFSLVLMMLYCRLYIYISYIHNKILLYIYIIYKYFSNIS